MRIGILALQGAVGPHREKLEALKAESALVRTAEEIAACAGLILPGGESTTLITLMAHYGLLEPLRAYAAERPVWGVCAGAILMAERVENPAQESLGVVPLAVRRNAYGRQNESFIAQVRVTLPGQAAQTIEGVFIRAPKILPPDRRAARHSTKLAEHEGDPIAVQHGHHLLTTFHPELSGANLLHEHFLGLCHARAARHSA